MISRLLAAALFTSVAAAAPAKNPGVNVVNPQRLSDVDQDELLEQLAAYGVTAIRVPLAGTTEAPEDFSSAIAFVEKAWKKGIKSTLNVFPQGKQSSRRAWNSQYPTLWGVFPLSQTSPEQTAVKVSEGLAAFDKAGVKLEGIEVGNEINYTAFNGDFPVPGNGQVYDFDDLTMLPNLKQVAQGFRVYVDVVRAVRKVRNASSLNRDTPIISAGLSDPGSKRVDPASNAEAITIPATLQYLRNVGLDQVVDAYGIHAYPSRGEFRGAALERRVFGNCSAPPNGKPCWLTEWGFKSKSVSCPPSDDERARTVGSFAKTVRKRLADRTVAKEFYYQWSGDKDPFGLFRCGTLTDAGKVLLQR